MPESDDVWAALSTVIHPTFGLSLVTLQMVKAVNVDGDSVTVELVMDCSVCASREAILGQVHRNLRDLVSAPRRLIVTLAAETWSPPWEDYWMTSGIDPARPIDDENQKDTKRQ